MGAYKDIHMKGIIRNSYVQIALFTVNRQIYSESVYFLDMTL